MNLDGDNDDKRCSGDGGNDDDVDDADDYADDNDDEHLPFINKYKHIWVLRRMNISK